jgi:hypothetical protein
MAQHLIGGFILKARTTYAFDRRLWPVITRRYSRITYVTGIRLDAMRQWSSND